MGFLFLAFFSNCSDYFHKDKKNLQKCGKMSWVFLSFLSLSLVCVAGVKIFNLCEEISLWKKNFFCVCRQLLRWWACDKFEWSWEKLEEKYLRWESGLDKMWISIVLFEKSFCRLLFFYEFSGLFLLQIYKKQRLEVILQNIEKNIFIKFHKPYRTFRFIFFQPSTVFNYCLSSFSPQYLLPSSGLRKCLRYRQKKKS